MPHPVTGLTTAQRLVESASNALHALTQFRAFAGGLGQGSQAYAPAVFSCYVQQSTRRYVALRLRANSGGATGATMTFDTQTGAITYQANDGTGATRTVGFESIGSGWYRIWLAVSGITPTQGWEASIIVCNASGAPAAYAGDGTSGIFAQYAQLEAGTAPGEYLATAAAPIDERFTQAGTYTFTVEARNGVGAATREFTQIVDGAATPSVAIEEPIVVQIGGTATVRVTVRNPSGLPMPGVSVTLASASPSVATVAVSPRTTGTDGVATFTLNGIAAGTSVLTATYAGNTDTATASVSTVTVASLSIAEPVRATVGGTASVSVTAIGTNGQPMAGVSVALSSGTTGVATVAASPQTTNGSGIATFTLNGVAAGTSVLTASAASGAVTDTTVAAVSAVAPPPTAAEAGSAWGRWIRGM